MGQEPVAELQTAFSSPGATATAWADAREHLEKAEIYWVTTVRPEGRPHVTPLVAVWQDDALLFSTGEHERKAKNLAANPHVVMTTGCNAFRAGFDVVVEGRARRVTDEGTLQRAADAFAAKYDWHFAVRAIADVLPNVRHRTLEGQGHGPADEVLAPALIEFFTAEE